MIGLLLEAVANIDAFTDNVRARRGGIDLEKDRIAVERFESMVAPWTGDEGIKLTAHFAQLLRDHREAFND